MGCAARLARPSVDVGRARDARESGRTPLEAYRDGLSAVLCSPGFLYLDEPGDTRLSAYELASRLSYFLWSSMPDQTLLDLAVSGALASGATD